MSTVSVNSPRHPLQARVAVVARRTRQLSWLQAVARLIAGATPAWLLAGAVDGWLRLEDRGVRAALSAAAAGWTAWLAHRWVWPALRMRWTDWEVARRIERVFPELRDQLSSSLEFLDALSGAGAAFSDGAPRRPRGSAALQRAVVDSTLARSESLDFLQCLDRRRVGWSCVWAAAAVAAAWAVCGADPARAALVARRLAAPWGGPDWPHRQQLVIVDPITRLARGDDWLVRVEDRGGNLPDTGLVRIKFQDHAESETQLIAMEMDGEQLVARLNNVVRSFHYQVQAGDDATSWRSLEVVEPPELQEVTVTIHPPEYAQLPAETTAGPIRALVGSRVEMQIRTSRPLRGAALRADRGPDLFGPEPDAAPLAPAPRRSRLPPLETPGGAADSEDAKANIRDASGPAPPGRDTIPMRLEAGGRLLRLTLQAPAWRLSAPGQYRYWLELTESDGRSCASPLRWPVEVLPDPPPTISIESPTDRLLVTPRAELKLRALLKDNLSLERVEAVWRLPAGAQRVEPLAVSEDPHGPRLLQLERAISLAPLQLAAGDSLSFRLEAWDRSPQATQSREISITVISSDELNHQLSQGQSLIMRRLAELIETQRDGRRRTLDLQQSLQDPLPRSVVDQLQSAELLQRRVSELLSGGAESLMTEILSVVEDLRRNQVDAPELSRQLKRLLDGLAPLSEGPVPAASRRLMEASRAARMGDGAKAVRPSLQQAGALQEQILRSLEELQRQLSQWDDYRRFGQQFAELLQSQLRLKEQTERLQLDVLTAELASRAPILARGRAAASEQLELARRLDVLLGRMNDMARSLETADPAAASTLQDALAIAGTQAISGEMRNSGRALELGQFGPAAAAQGRVVEGLQSLLETLANRQEQDLQRRAAALRALAGDLAGLRQQAELLSGRLEQSANRGAAALRSEASTAEAIKTRLQPLIDQLSGLRVAAAASHLQQAGSRMAAAAAQAREGQGSGAAGQAQAAAGEIAEGQRAVSAALSQLEQEQADAAAARLEAAAHEWLAAQIELRDQTRALSAEGSDSPWARLSAEQRELAAATGGGDAQPVFLFALQRLRREMELAAQRLERLEKPPALEHQDRAVEQLEQLAAALRPTRQDAGGPPANPQDAAAGAGEGPPQVRSIAELKMIREIQKQCLDQTAALHQRRAAWSEEDRMRLRQLQADQQKVQEMLRAMVSGDPAGAPRAAPPPKPPEDPLDEILKRES